MVSKIFFFGFNCDKGVAPGVNEKHVTILGCDVEENLELSHFRSWIPQSILCRRSWSFLVA